MDDYAVAEVFQAMRFKALTWKPREDFPGAFSDMPVWGLLMETGLDQAVFTLLAMGEGSVSLYFSNGGGIIGLGQHEGPKRISKELLALAPKYLRFAQPTTEFPLPKRSYSRFYFLTHEAVLTVEEKEVDLGNSRLPLSPLFLKAHELIHEARLIDQQRKQDKQE